MDKGYSLFGDNCYNFVTLAIYLAKRSTYICGSLRGDGKGNPYAVTKAKLKKGEFHFCRSGNVVVCKWKDKKDVLTIGNKRTNPEEVPVSNRRGDQNQKPSIVRDYNKGTPGIDRTDQMLSYLSLT